MPRITKQNHFYKLCRRLFFNSLHGRIMTNILGGNGNIAQMDDERKTKTPKPVTFPWIHMGKVLIAMRRVHEDLKQTGYI